MIGTAIAGVAQGISNLIGTNATNKTNLRIARMNNDTQVQMANDNMAWQEAMQDKMNQWNLDQWNRENEYNSAAAQVQRFHEAGINPALAMTGGANAGQASSMQSAEPAASPGLPNLSTPQMSAPDLSGAFSQIGHAFDMLQQQPLIDSQVDQNKAQKELFKQQSILFKEQAQNEVEKRSGIKFDNEYKEYKKETEFWNKWNRQQDYNRAVTQGILDARTSMLKFQEQQLINDNLRADIVLKGLDGEAKVKANSYLDEKFQKELALMTQQRLYYISQRGRMVTQSILDSKNSDINWLKSYTSAQKDIADTIRTYKENRHIPDLTDQDIDDISKAYVRSYLNGVAMEGLELEGMFYDNKFKRDSFKFWPRMWRQSVSPITTSAGALLGGAGSTMVGASAMGAKPFVKLLTK